MDTTPQIVVKKERKPRKKSDKPLKAKRKEPSSGIVTYTEGPVTVYF
jgi:hypothetical protein